MTVGREMLVNEDPELDVMVLGALKDVYGVRSVNGIDPSGAWTALQLAKFFQDPADYSSVAGPLPDQEVDHAA